MHIVSRFRAIGPWLAGARYLWISFGVIVAALLVLLWWGPSESKIRLIGLVLQVLGIGTVAWGISETRAHFGYPSISSTVKQCLRRFPLLRRDAVGDIETASIEGATGDAHAYGIAGPGSNPAVESRLDALEESIKNIHERISETQKDMDKRSHQADEALKLEVQSRKNKDEILGKELEETATGDVHISAIGASWLLVGVVLSTAAPEIADWLC